MSKQLTVLNATVTTAAVEVKTLTISGKQVTLAVFRQLIEEPILDTLDATITGNAWGRVNYHPDKCADSPEHIHVVCQKGDELRRSTVQAPHAGRHTHPAADLYVQARIIHGTVHNAWREPAVGDILRLGECIRGGWRHFSGGRFTHDGMAFDGSIPASLREAWRDERGPSARDRETFEEQAYCLGIPDAASRNHAENEFLRMLPTAQYRESWTELSALPQLFIAV